MPERFRYRIKGQAELDRAFLQLRRDVLRELRPALRLAAKPVADESERLAGQTISNIGTRWSKFRVGVLAKGAYVAPRARRRSGSPRPNLAGLLLEDAMQPALEAKQGEVLAKVELLVDESAARAGFF